jgi:hypothetical protein
LMAIPISICHIQPPFGSCIIAYLVVFFIRNAIFYSKKPLNQL